MHLDRRIAANEWAPECRRLLAFVMILGLAVCPLTLPAQSVTLAWDPSTSTNVAGYAVYYGSDEFYFDGQMMDVGTNTIATVTGLEPGSTYFFAVVAYDVNYGESLPANRIEYTVPGNDIAAKADNSVTFNARRPVTASFSLFINGNGTVAPNLTGKALQLGNKYTLTATPAKGSVFANWVSNGIVVATTPKYTLSVAPNVAMQANFIPNPFIPLAGTYHGLFYVSDNAAEESSGSFVATVTSAGAYSAKLCLGAGSYSHSGVLSLTGAASKSILRPGLSPLTVQLQLGLTNGPLTGTISDGTWTADLMADAVVYSKANPAPQAGKYTVLIPGSENASTQPGGDGFGAVTVSDEGNVTFSGMLGDGTTITSTSIVSSEGQWPLYVSLYGGQGSILGWLSFTTDGGIGGQTGWFKLPQATAKLYPGGFTNGAEAMGSAYRYNNDLPILNFTAGQLSLLNGDLAQSIINQISLGPDAQATNQSDGNLIFTTASGLFKGSVINPETGNPITINGVVLQNQNFGAGFFLGASESGEVLLLHRIDKTRSPSQ
jgi:hypothetical protein